MEEGPRILVIKLSSLGDLLHALPAVHALRCGWKARREAARGVDAVAREQQHAAQAVDVRDRWNRWHRRWTQPCARSIDARPCVVGIIRA